MAWYTEKIHRSNCKIYISRILIFYIFCFLEDGTLSTCPVDDVTPPPCPTKVVNLPPCLTEDPAMPQL